MQRRYFGKSKKTLRASIIKEGSHSTWTIRSHLIYWGIVSRDLDIQSIRELVLYVAEIRDWLVEHEKALTGNLVLQTNIRVNWPSFLLRESLKASYMRNFFLGVVESKSPTQFCFIGVPTTIKGPIPQNGWMTNNGKILVFPSMTYPFSHIRRSAQT
jgi:hypothetical protein